MIVIGLDIVAMSRARITISDDGPGLGELSSEAAFSLFFTTRDGEGSGLGLAVAREIVKDHGGEIELAQSDVDGAVFHVDLPLAEVAV